MKNSSRVLLIATAHSSFIRTDAELIRSFSRLTLRIGSGIVFLFRIFFSIPFHSVIVCWFGTVYAALAVFWSKLFKKKIIIILGGMDAIQIPELGYGIWMIPWKAHLLRRAYPRADALLAVSPALKDSVRQLAGYNAGNIHFAPTACDASFWTPEGTKEPWVMTVAHSGFNVSTKDALRRFRIKGLDWLFRCAAQKPDMRFVLIGYDRPLLERMGIQTPDNIETIAFLPPEQLRNYYRRARVYCQPSRSEGLPNTLCEAMACACVPVGSEVGGIPEAIGQSGFIVPYADDTALLNALQIAMQSEPIGVVARERIVKEFSFERRRKDLQYFIYK